MTESRREARGDTTAGSPLSGIEAKLYLSALLAAVYAIAWIELVPRTPSGGAGEAASADAREPATAVRLGDRPVNGRAVVPLPPGWAVASSRLGSSIERPRPLKRERRRHRSRAS